MLELTVLQHYGSNKYSGSRKHVDKVMEEKVQQELFNTQIMIHFFFLSIIFKSQAAGQWEGFSNKIIPYACLF